MKYVILMYTDPSTTEAMTPEQMAEVLGKHKAFREELTGTGELLNGAGMFFPKETTTMRWHEDGPTTVTSGPFVDASDQLSAYYVIDCATPERAQAIAERVLDFHVVAVEVRGVHDSHGMA